MTTPRNLAQLWELYEERAAIREYLGNVPRAQAEREAHAEIFGPEQPKQGRLL